MARVVVVGGGFGGMAVAARLAKLGHAVTLLERGPRLGGALVPVEQDGFTWDGGPTYTLLPAVVRDLFRKSGRPAERELDLVELDVLREHRFPDGSSVRLPVRLAGRADPGGRRPGARPRDAVGRPRAGLRGRLGGAPPGVPRTPLGPRPPARPAGRPAPQPGDAGQAGPRAQGRPAADDGHLRRGRRGARTSRRARLGRRDGVRRATLRRVDRRRRDGRRSPTPW